MVDEQADAREELTDSMVIYRWEWSGTDKSRKDGNGSSCTPNYKGELCCLGHYLRKLKLLPPVDSCILAMPGELGKAFRADLPSWMIDEKLGGHNSQVARELAAVNDSPIIDQAVKEATIAYVFEQYGVDVVFKD